MSFYDRRRFLKTTAISSAFLTTTKLDAKIHSSESKGKYMGDFIAPRLDKIKIALIGVGYRGKGHIVRFGSIQNTQIVAISDLHEVNISKSLSIIDNLKTSKNHKNVKTYWGDENKWKLMLKETNADIVVISTNWNNHGIMAVESMKNDLHAFVEVPMATSIKELWDIVNTSEKYQKHCMMMENVNYGREELMFLNICRKGLLGELLHGDLYPTHGLGPVSQYMNLLRTEDTFKTLVSFSSPSAGRKIFAKDNFNKNHKWNKLNFQNGDINTSIIKTYLGRTIMVQWDETSPRPYTRLNLIQGTKGALAGGPTRAAFDGGFKNFTKDSKKWIEGEGIQHLYEKYDHPMYKRLNELSKDSGHGGMDGMMVYRIIECLRNGEPLDQNIYEGCAWSSLIELTSKSANQGGAPQEFPDFTRGNWVSTKPFNIKS